MALMWPVAPPKFRPLVVPSSLLGENTDMLFKYIHYHDYEEIFNHSIIAAHNSTENYYSPGIFYQNLDNYHPRVILDRYLYN